MLMQGPHTLPGTTMACDKTVRQAIGFRVINAGFRFGIETDGPASTDSDVSQVALG
jgi:hypothetical protein